MSTNRFFRATHGAALVFMSLGGGALALSGAGCGQSVTGLCQQICDCTGCNTTQRQACEAGFNDAQNVSTDKGCTTQYNAYLGCVESHVQCIGTTIDLAACTVETAALASCTGTTVMTGGTPSAVSCDQTTSGTHICVLYANLTAAQVTAVGSSCMQSNGTSGTSCATAGALGSCKETAGGITASITYFPAGGLTASEAQSGCTSGGGTWTGN